MRIRRLIARDIKRLRAVDIVPKGSTVILTGKNKQGKSSVIDSIAMGLAGKKAIPDEPVRQGQRKGEVILELDDLIVTRRITKSNAYLEITTRSGVPQKAPQKMLEELVGTDHAFAPLEWLRQDAKGQVDTLKKLAGLDFTAIDEERASAYAERRFINRGLKEKEAERKAMVVPDRPEAAGPKTTTELLEELRRRRDVNSANAKVRDAFQEFRGRVVEQQKAREKLVAQLAEMDTQLANLAAKQKQEAANVSALRDEDEDEIGDQLDRAEEIKAAFDAIGKAQAADMEIEDLRAQADAKTRLIEKCDDDKADLVAKAKMPVEGIGLKDDHVTLNGLPFDQASDAEKLCAAVSIALEMANELKVVLIRNGSLLDEDSMALVEKIVEDAGGQLWIEVVDSDHPSAVIIEDGRVKGDGE